MLGGVRASRLLPNAGLDDLIIVAKVDGRTQCRRLQKPKAFRDRPLGDLWVTGELGGVP